jgi:hypothetical protein
MNADTLVREWGLITELLPPEWQDLARTTGAFQRARNVSDPSTLLLLILLHAASGLSLRQSAARAARMGIASLSDVGLLKRLRSSRDWLHALAAGMFSTSGFQTPVEGILAGRRLRVVDGTSISEPGSSGTDWRLHYCLQLPSLECDFFEVSDPSVGESYRRFPVLPGDIILADRGYAHRDGVAHVIEAGGDVVVRLNMNSFPLEHPGGAPFLLLPHLRQLSGFEPGEWRIEFRAGGTTYRARLCAVRKTEAAAERGRDQARKTAARKQRQVQPDTLELAEYTFVLTTLGEAFTTADILELYRARWQVELAFKRLKTLLGLGHLPKYDPDSAKAWLHAKLLAVLLIERLGERARLFSPWGFQLRPAESLA